MKPRSKFTMLICVALAVLLAAFTVGYTFAWFANYATIEISLYTEDGGGYFAGGDGKSEETAYQIANYKHLYNLAWLQNMGKFDDDIYYFELTDDINMCVNDTYYCVIPPIGNDAHPFNGVFYGNGNTISNLVVSTDKSKLSNTDAAKAYSYEFSQYVGLFGNTGTSSNIYYFILDNPIVEVASSNTSYSSSSSSYCGLAIGYVAGKASSIGVIGGYLYVSKGGYSTYNSILGDIDENVSTSVTGGSVGEIGSGGSGTGTSFGGSISISSIYNRLKYIATSSQTWTTPSVEYVTGDNDPSSNISSGSAMPIVVSNDITESYYNSNTAEQIHSSNIGYITGSQAKIQQKSPGGVLLAQDCYENYSSTAMAKSDDYSELGTSYTGTLTDINIYEFVDNGSGGHKVQVKTDIDSNIKTDVLALLNESKVYSLSFSGQLSTNNWMNFYNATIAGQTYDQIDIPQNAIWFIPQEDGFIKVVAMTMKNSTRNVSFYLINRSNGVTFYSKNYSSGTVSNVSITQISTIYKLTNKTTGEVSYEYNSSCSDTSTYTYECTYSYSWDWNSSTGDVNNRNLKERVIYIEIPVYQGQEYAFGAINGTDDANIIYLDIGQNGDGSGSTTESTGEYDSDYDVSAIDFIYSGVSIRSGSFKVRSGTGFTYDDYTPTKTRITFTAVTDDSATIVLGFYRNGSGYYSSTDTSDTAYTITVTYYISVYGAPSGSNAYIVSDSSLVGLSIPPESS